MSEITIIAPTPGRVVLFDAAPLRPGMRSMRVPAIVHGVLEGARVTLWAVDSEGGELRSPDGGLPVAEYGELTGGVPRSGCWCWPGRSERPIRVRVDTSAQADTVRLRPLVDFSAEEETFRP